MEFQLHPIREWELEAGDLRPNLRGANILGAGYPICSINMYDVYFFGKGKVYLFLGHTGEPLPRATSLKRPLVLIPKDSPYIHSYYMSLQQPKTTTATSMSPKKRLISSTMVSHVDNNSWYICQSSSAEQQGVLSNDNDNTK